MLFNKKNLPPGFYVYMYLRKDGTPYYVGKGFASRAWVQHRNNKTKSGVHTPSNDRIVIVAYNLTEIWSFIIERKVIRWYRRKDVDYSNSIDLIPLGILHNKTDGGEGTHGHKSAKGMLGKTQTESAKKAMSESKKGGNNPNYGKIYSKEEAKKFGHTRNKGSKRGDIQKQKMKDSHADFSGSNNPNFGKTHKESTLEKMRIPKVRICRLIDRKEMSVNYFNRTTTRH
jgi:hypothetical protein